MALNSLIRRVADPPHESSEWDKLRRVASTFYSRLNLFLVFFSLKLKGFPSFDQIFHGYVMFVYVTWFLGQAYGSFFIYNHFMVVKLFQFFLRQMIEGQMDAPPLKLCRSVIQINIPN